ncbi:hypothetical protein LWI29_022166 [Acer saccharum]|uniref:BED-type domain-containing protein n=1 Tax=Acer saccharum TaxID=4024 RepID=A0AA39SPR4_ACESA|nr:hypothetical protein LWI29_022166 [Acer saccharum]
MDIQENPPIDASNESGDKLTKITTPNKNGKTGTEKRKKRSPAWNLFEVIPGTEHRNKHARCKTCGKEYNCGSKCGTGNMLEHLKTCPRNVYGDVGEMLFSPTQPSGKLRSPKFDPETVRDLLIQAIIKHELPFNFVEYEGIRTVFEFICSDIKLPCRNTAKTCVVRMFNHEKLELQNLLNLVPGRICLTSDLWTSIATDGYLTLAAHFVDNDWRLHKKILNFCRMPPPYTGVALSNKINSLLFEWGIEKKLFSITLDNASANKSFVDILRNQLNFRGALLMSGKFFHVRCCAHILNLIVQDGLREIDESVLKIQECIKYMKGSPARKHKFYDCVAQVGMVGNKRGLRQDVPTRWNSTYLMLESALFYRRAFINLGLNDSSFNCCPSPDEWDKFEKISKFLGHFYEVTCLFSGTKFHTSNLFFPKIFLIQNSITEAMVNTDSFLRKMGLQMSLKFEKYWSECNQILAIATILDPRYKF